VDSKFYWTRATISNAIFWISDLISKSEFAVGDVDARRRIANGLLVYTCSKGRWGYGLVGATPRVRALPCRVSLVYEPTVSRGA
jgi:hypothetical protein